MNRSEIPAEAKDTSYIDVDVTLGDNQLNDNVVNHYNALNQLTETLTKNYKVSFTYDAEGLRTGKTVNGEKTVYVWDGDQVVMELSKGGAVQKRYIRGNDLVYADKGENTEKTYYVTDMHGNVVQLLDESGNVTKNIESFLFSFLLCFKDIYILLISGFIQKLHHIAVHVCDIIRFLRILSFIGIH